MPKMKASELRNESDADLQAKLELLSREIYDLRSQKLESKTQSIHLIAEKRKNRARILTIQNERGRK